MALQFFSSDQTGHVHEISLASGYNASFYQTIDLSIMCPQLFDGQKLLIALLRNPLNIIYFVRGDGVLLSLTYEPKQQVWAWADITPTVNFVYCRNTGG